MRTEPTLPANREQSEPILGAPRSAPILPSLSRVERRLIPPFLRLGTVL